MFLSESVSLENTNGLSLFELYLDTMDSMCLIESDLIDFAQSTFEEVKTRFLEFLDRIREIWINIQMKIKTTLFRNKKLNKIIDILEHSGKKGWFFTTGSITKVKVANEVIRQMEYIPNTIYHYSTLFKNEGEDSNIDFSDIEEHVNKVLEVFIDLNNVDNNQYNQDYVTLGTYVSQQDTANKYSSYVGLGYNSDKVEPNCNTKDVRECQIFLLNREKAITSLNNLKKAVKAFKGRENKDDIKDCERVCNKTIYIVNRITKEALSICKDAACVAKGIIHPEKDPEKINPNYGKGLIPQKYKPIKINDVNLWLQQFSKSKQFNSKISNNSDIIENLNMIIDLNNNLI